MKFVVCKNYLGGQIVYRSLVPPIKNGVKFIWSKYKHYFSDSTCLCASCQFCFCILCERSSHGTSPCAVNNSRMKGIFEEYKSATDRNDQAKIKSLLSQYGANLQHLIELHQNLEFIRENSMPCPKCRQAIQKMEGCNKMTCSTCQVRIV